MGKATRTMRAFLFLAVASIAAIHALPSVRTTCDLTGSWNCTQNGYCVNPGVSGHPQGTDGYYEVNSNGNEFDTYSVVGDQKDADGVPMFMHSTIRGGCEIDDPTKGCSFFENELFTPIPGSSGMRWSGFTVNRT